VAVFAVAAAAVNPARKGPKIELCEKGKTR